MYIYICREPESETERERESALHLRNLAPAVRDLHTVASVLSKRLTSASVNSILTMVLNIMSTLNNNRNNNTNKDTTNQHESTN